MLKAEGSKQKASLRFNNIRRLRRLSQIKSLTGSKLKAEGSKQKAIHGLIISADYGDYRRLIY
jgi:hypothetical protein